ncbi:hypothetical protein OROGR_027585 [Orobanche gracilis]
MTTAISWIPKGVLKSEPFAAADLTSGDTIDVDEVLDAQVAQALARAINNGKSSSSAIGNKRDDDAITLAMEDLHMENYDDEDEDDLYYGSGESDPYLEDKNDVDDSEELEDMIIKPTDSLIALARDEVIEVRILEDSTMNNYVHHHFEIAASPLCIAWLEPSLKGEETGNLLAVGSMETFIEIWDLDDIDAVEPCAVLGGITIEEKRRRKKKSIKSKGDCHTDSVLGLAWNKCRYRLASASADKQVKIWDIAAEKCCTTMKHHSDTVQAVAWNHGDPDVLLSGSYDHTVAMNDWRIPSRSVYKWSVTADVECLAWDPHNEHFFVVSLEDGIVKCFDKRNAKSDSTSDLSSFTLDAHDKAVQSVSYNPSAPNLLATGSEDQTVKLWDLSNNQPSCVASKTSEVGAVFSISFSADNPFVLAIGGTYKGLQIWDTLSDFGISTRYKNYKV